jgi:hypothetical protein
MRMRVDEAWQHHATGSVKSLRIACQRMGFNLCAVADSDDEAVDSQERAIFYKSDIGKGSAAARSAST